MRTLILSSIAVMSLALEQVGPAAAAAPASGDACALLTEADASALVGKPGKATPGTFDMLGPTCTWNGAGQKLHVQLETDESLAAATPHGPKQTAAARFAAVKDQVKDKKAVAVSGVGQDAVWQTEFSLLWVLKKKKVAVVSIVQGFSNQNDLERVKGAAIKIATKL